MPTRTNRRTLRLIPVAPLLVAAIVVALIGTGCHPVGTGGPSAPNHPVGVLESVTGGSGTVRVTGWATDNWDTWYLGPPAGPRRPATVVVVLNGQWVSQAFTASGPRPDVGALLARFSLPEFTQPGDTYGFDFTLPAPPGPATVCVGAINSSYPHLVMSAEEAAARGIGLGMYADHSFIACNSTTVA